MSELSLKSAKSFYLTLGQSIQELEVSTDAIIKGIDDLKRMVGEKPLILNHYYATLYVNFINLDICAAYRLYIAGTTHYEQRFAVKQLYTIMNEGYKRLYGFDNICKDGELRKPQKGAVWDTYMSIYETCGIPEIETAYQFCISKFGKFYDPIIFNQEARCHGAHYNKDFYNTYNFLKDLNAETVTTGATKFFDFLDSWRAFIAVISSSVPKIIASANS